MAKKSINKTRKEYNPVVTKKGLKKFDNLLKAILPEKDIEKKKGSPN